MRIRIWDIFQETLPENPWSSFGSNSGRTRLYRELSRKVCALPHRVRPATKPVASQQTKPSGFLTAIARITAPNITQDPWCGMPLPLRQRNRTVVHSTMVARLAGGSEATLSPSPPPPPKKPVCPRSPRIVCCSSVATSYLQPKFKFSNRFLSLLRSFAQKCFVFLMFPPLRVYSSR